MSRLIVRGLPKYLNEDRLRDHFGKQGNVTDVKLMKKRNGESRRFGFVGYKSFEDARKAVEFFNGTFVDTSRIEVELAKTFSDPSVPLPFKEKRRLNEMRLREEEERLLQEEEQRRVKRQRKGTSHIDEEINSNPKLREFMEVMKPSHQVKSWSNDAVVDGEGGPGNKELEETFARENITGVDASENVAGVPDAASDDEYDEYNKKAVSESEEEMVSLNAFNGDNTMAKDDQVSDLDWLKQRRIRMRDNEEHGESRTDRSEIVAEKTSIDSQDARDVEEMEVVETEGEKAINKINETGRLFIRNISYSSTEEDFRELFAAYGPLEEVHIAIDSRTGKCKGFVYVQFKNSEDAITAFQTLDKQIFQGRLLHIIPAEGKKDHRLNEFDIKNLPLKKQRELKKKAQASKTQFSWNSLFMNTDAVMDSVAAKLNISKSELIDPENSSSAVQQALAEAHVIGDVRKYFEERGVDLASFNKKERDDKLILVKNFPFGTTIEELGEMFAAHGTLKRMLMPPAGTIAMFEFRDAPSARAAFTKLAYRRFKETILYLEKGPKDCFIREPKNNEKVDDSVGEQKAVEAETTKDMDNVLALREEEAEEQTFEGATVSVFVKNLNFATTKDGLARLFQALPGYVVATVKTKPDPKNSGSFLSMGFGFVEFETREQAATAISTFDGHVLDGHKLQLKLSHRQSTAGNNAKADKSKKSSKIIIKNLPFEAARKDVFTLFSAFGQLKSVRVPKKFDRSARGFAFVEFTLTKEAENAMNQLEGVHLLGRKLVMQYAQQDAVDAETEIERMTRRVKKQVATTELAQAQSLGKGKIDLEEEEEEEF